MRQHAPHPVDGRVADARAADLAHVEQAPLQQRRGAHGFADLGLPEHVAGVDVRAAALRLAQRFHETDHGL